MLLDDLQTSHTIRLGKRLASYTHSQDGQAVELHFQDGTTATCDVLVGADGIRSAVREAMFTQLASAAQESGKAEEAADLRACIPELFSGFVIYRTLIHKASLPQEDGKHPALNKAGISAVSDALPELRLATLTERRDTWQYMGKNKVCTLFVAGRPSLLIRSAIALHRVPDIPRSHHQYRRCCG